MGVFNNWAIIGLMAFGFIFKSLLGLLAIQNSKVLLNNFSKSYPNLSLIAKRVLDIWKVLLESVFF